MIINSELLRESIADAKAIKATAVANARASLSEAFAPRFEAMFAEKLKEETQDYQEEEETMKEVEAPNQVSGKGGEAKAPPTKPVSNGNPKQPNDSSKQFEPVKAGLGPDGVSSMSVNENEEGNESDEIYQEDSDKMEQTGKMEEMGLTSEDLDEIIKELENEVASEEDGQKFSNLEKGLDSNEDSSEEANVDAEPGSEVDVNLDGDNTDDCNDVDKDKQQDSDESGMNAGESDENNNDSENNTDDEDINLEELLSALNEESDEDEENKEEMDETVETGFPKNVGGQDKSETTVKSANKNHNIQGKGNIGSGTVGGKPMEEQYKIALKESYKTITFLRSQINEVNLLNSKLLYTNKLFKEFASILDDSRRMKIVETFDLTKNVREVKMSYATMAELLSFGTQPIVQKNNKPSSVFKNNKVKQITEGFASKPVSSTKPSSNLITEGSAMALRFKKLAGIKETPKK